MWILVLLSLMAIYFILFESNLISIVENRLMYLYKSNSRYFNNILFFYIRAVVIVWECNYLCNQCLSLLQLWVWIPFMTRCTRYNIMWKRLWVTCEGWWFSLGTPVSSTNKTDLNDIPKLLLKLALNTTTLTPDS